MYVNVPVGTYVRSFAKKYILFIYIIVFLHAKVKVPSAMVLLNFRKQVERGDLGQLNQGHVKTAKFAEKIRC